MNNQNAIDIMIIFQIVGFFAIYFERYNIRKSWGKIPKKKLFGRIFMFFLPTLTIISLLYRPL